MKIVAVRKEKVGKTFIKNFTGMLSQSTQSHWANDTIHPILFFSLAPTHHLDIRAKGMRIKSTGILILHSHVAPHLHTKAHWFHTQTHQRKLHGKQRLHGEFPSGFPSAEILAEV